MNRAEWEERGDQITREMLELLTREDSLHGAGRIEEEDAGHLSGIGLEPI
jgi:hypothetical protein